MGKTIFQSGYAPGGGITSGTTQYWSPNCPPTTQTTTEAICQHRIRTPGTFSNLQIRLASNSVSTGNSTFRSRKNGANGGQTVTIPQNTSGLFEDTSGSDAVVDGDLVNVQMVAGTGAMGIVQFSQLFSATTNTVTKLSCNHVALTGDSFNYYFAPGTDGINQTEAQAKLRIRKAGTFKKLAIYVQTARTTNTTLRSRKNGANGNLSVLMTASTTGWFEDTTNSDTVAVDDDYNLNVSNGTGTATNTYRNITVDFETTDGSGLIVLGNVGAVAFAEPLDVYNTLAGRLVANATETNRQTEANASFVFSNISCYVTANTHTAASTVALRVNGADSALVASITATSTGVFVDSSNTVNVGATDLLLFHLNFPSAVGTLSTSLTWVAVWYEETAGLTRVSKSQIYRYTITERVQSPKIYRYAILSQVSAPKIFRYSILSQVSAAKIYRYSILSRVALARLYRYSILSRASLAVIYLYSISNFVSASKIYRYSISNLVTVSKIYRYSIQSRVSQIETYLYNINSRVSNSEIYRYSILGRAALARIYKYNIQGRIQQARIYRYSIVQRITTPKIYRYSILSKVSLAQIYRYSIQARVSLVRTYIYNLGESGQFRVSKTMTYLYHVIGRTQLPQVYRYSLLQRAGTNALNFDGVNDYMQLGTDAGLWNNALSSFTFTIWIRPSIVGGDGFHREIVQRGFGQAYGLDLYYYATLKRLYFELVNNTWPGRISSIYVDFTNLPPDQWYHVAVVYDASLTSQRSKIYLNCESRAVQVTDAAGEVLTNATQLLISGPSADFKGLIRDFRWFTNQALDMEQIMKVCADAPDAPPPNYWLKMNEYAGSPVDSITGTKTATLTNGPNWIQSLNAISLDGINDCVDCGTGSALWSQSLTKFSLSLWVYVQDLSITKRAIVDHSNNNTAQGFLIFRDGTVLDKVSFRIVEASGTTKTATSVTPPTTILNRWLHIVATYDNSLGTQNLKIYLDGVLSGSQVCTEAINLSLSLKLGVDTVISGGPPNMIVKDFRWWTTKPLTQTEVGQVMRNEPEAPTPNYWLKINEGTGNPVDNITGNSSTLTGGAAWAAAAPDVWLGNADIYRYGTLKRVGADCITFDGVDDSIDLGNDAILWSRSLTKFSFSFWFNPDIYDATNNRWVVSHGGFSAQSFYVYCDGPGTPNRIVFTIRNAANGIAAATFNGIFPGNWYHVTCTYDNSLGSENLKIYVNGVLGVRAALTEAINRSASLILSPVIDATNKSLDGFIKDFRWFTNRALTQTEINSIYVNAPTDPYLYETLPSNFDITTDNTLSPNGKWRCVYRGLNPQNGSDPGKVGVRTPGSPTGGFTRVWYTYPYSLVNTGTDTGASLVLSEMTQPLTDIDITLYVRTIAQKRSAPAAWETAWIMFRYNLAGNTPDQTASRFHHYYLALKANGTLELGRKDNTVQAEEQYFLDTSATYSFALGQWNKVRIRAIGNPAVITVWIDDVQKINLTDNGSIGTPPANTPAVPSAFMSSGYIGMYNEDAETEFSAITITPAPIPDYWLKINEGSGNPVDTISGTKTGVLTNGASWAAAAPDVWLGKLQRYIYSMLQRVVDWAITFDGVDDQITIPNIAAINNLDDFTVSCWIYPITSNPSSTAHVFTKNYSSNNSFILYFTANTFILNYRTINNSAVGVSATSGIALTPNRWSHLMVTFVRSTGAMKLYIDGVLRASATNAGALANAMGGVANMTINGGPGVKWTGHVKDFRLWRSNVEADITKIYTNDPTAPTPNYWQKMEEGTGSPIEEISGSNPMTLQNGATWISLPPISRFVYNILGRVSQLEIYRYGILNLVTKANIYRYSILARIAQTRIYRYGILERAALARIYRYGILTRLAVPKIYRYGILERRSLSQLYKYNILGRLSLLRNYKYSILGRLSAPRIYRYTIIGRVSKAFTFLYNIAEPPSPVKWQLTGQKTDFPQKLEEMITNYLAVNWSITDPVLGPTPTIKEGDIPQHVAQIDNFAFDNHRTYYIKVKQTGSEVQTRKIRMNTYEFATPIEFECFARRLTKGEAFKQLNNMINELMRVFGTYNKEQLFGIQGITFDRISQMDRERPEALTTWARRFKIILHYYKVSVIG